jgi:hypothetical protein
MPKRQCGMPTPRSTLRARYVTLLVWCKGGCRHQAEADLQGLVETGRGDVPLTALRFRYSNCSIARSAPRGRWRSGTTLDLAQLDPDNVAHTSTTTMVARHH